MRKILFIASSCFFTTLVFSQQQSQQLQQQTQNRISNFTNILIQNVSTTNLNNNDNNNVQVVSNPRPRTRINRPNRTIVSLNNASNKPPVISQRRIARRPPRRQVARIANTLSNNPVVNTNPSLGNEASTSFQNVPNNTDFQLQNFVSNVSKNPLVQSGNGNSQLNLNVNFSFNVKTTTTVKSASSYAGSSARYKSRTFSKKFTKFKRHFFGKLTAHKKSKRHIDICFNWKS